jgi:hypothetical protein
MGVVYQKTDKGRQEMTSRAHGLKQAARTVLLMVDGKRNDTDLRAQLPAPLHEEVARLLEQGFIEALTSAPAPAPAAAAPAPDLQMIRKNAAHALTVVLGPQGDHLALRIERAASLQELQSLLFQAYQLMGDLGRSRQAQGFAERFGIRT